MCGDIRRHSVGVPLQKEALLSHFDLLPGNLSTWEGEIYIQIEMSISNSLQPWFFAGGDSDSGVKLMIEMKNVNLFLWITSSLGLTFFIRLFLPALAK